MSLQKPDGKAEHETALEKAVSGVALAIADPSRVRMLCALMDGRAWTATELSAVADIAASTASAHLAKLLSGGLVTCLSQGRHRYYRLAGSDIADLLETMMAVSMKRVIPPPVTRTPVPLRLARTCYDHLAGELAVKLYDFMVEAQWIAGDGSALTPAGRQHFHALGIAPNPQTRRKHCCACLDWSERRFHLGGNAGAAFLNTCIEKGWLSRVPGYREVLISEAGHSAFARLFRLGDSPPPSMSLSPQRSGLA